MPTKWPSDLQRSLKSDLYQARRWDLHLDRISDSYREMQSKTLSDKAPLSSADWEHSILLKGGELRNRSKGQQI